MTVNDADQGQQPPDTACILFTITDHGVVESFSLHNRFSLRTGPLSSAVMALMTNHADELDALYRKEVHAPDHRNG